MASSKMSNFALTAISDESNVTFDYNSANGSVTAGGTAVASGDVQKVTKDGTTLVATAATGAKFLGWVDKSSNMILSQSAEYLYIPSKDATGLAVFAKADPWFIVDNSYMYNGFNAAATAAKQTMVLANDATLSAGDYTVPAGITMATAMLSAITDKLYTGSSQVASDVASQKPVIESKIEEFMAFFGE